MIATISVQSLRMSSIEDSFPRSSNTAGAPLPLIPRRSASSSRIHITPSKISSPAIILQRASPSGPSRPSPTSPGSNSDSSSSSSPDHPKSPRIKRRRGVRHTTSSVPSTSSIPPITAPVDDVKMSSPPASSVASTSSQSTVYVPGTPMKLTLQTLKAHAASEVGKKENLFTPSSPISHDSRPITLRKKSGQLVKSSLKASKPTIRGNLSVVTSQWSSKSEPNTPSKAVHFDSQLEHVKLFLAEQKPLAVSRDGSPTDDTTDADSDFPSFIYGDSADARKPGRRLTMQLANMPPIINMQADLALQELKLSPDGTQLVGRVRVRNIAYNKWVAIRFTFDAWQTTSEVTGRWVETLDKDFDAFTFNIRLNDLLARIDGKTMIMALRYVVNGREIWDNNGGQNYLATFNFVTPRLRSNNASSSGEESIANPDDLQSRLEKVVKWREHDDKDAGRIPPLKSSASFASRYDFSVSLSRPRDDLVLNNRHVRSQSHSGVSPSSIPWPSQARSQSTQSQPPMIKAGLPVLGSPRDGHDFRTVVFGATSSDGENSISSGPHLVRNHQRGYFDLSIDNSNVRKTPPGTPGIMNSDEPSPNATPRFHSFPPLHDRSIPRFSPPVEVPPDAMNDGASDMSTPSLISPTSTTGSSSPLSADAFLVGMSDSEPSATNYSQFIHKFCFYTGPQTSSSPLDPPSRSSSTSSLDDDILPASTVLSSTQKSSGEPDTHDDPALGSGTATPRAVIFSAIDLHTPSRSDL